MAENVEEAATKRRRRSRRGTGHSLGLTGDPASGPRAVMPPRPGQVLAEKYRIEELLGRGGMGAVYTATHLVSDKRVAVKWMLPAQSHSEELSERFIREARATARIDHPNVVDIYDVGTHEGSVYLVMELLQGETLAQRLDRAPVTPTEAASLLMPALRAVSAAHAQGVIHRDLKPDNIFLCSSREGELREVKVLDFGISKIATDDRRDLAMTASGMVMGTPYYMSPEQIRGLKGVDLRGDVYAFGVILYEMLADCYPYDADTYNALILKIATTDPVSLSELNPELDPGLVEIVMRAMARDLDQRYQSVEQLAYALEPFAGGVTFRMSNTPQGAMSVPASMRAAKQSGSARAAGSTQRGQQAQAAQPNRRKLAALLAAGVALVLLSALWAALRDGRELESQAPQAEAGEHEVTPARPSAAPTPAKTAAAMDSAGPGLPMAPDPALAPAVDAREPRAAEPASAGRRKPRSQTRVPAAATANPGTTGARPTLPSNWDERLSTGVPGRAASNAATESPKTSAGSLSPDQL